MTTKDFQSRLERQWNTYGADGQPTILGAEVTSGEVEILADAEPGTMRAFPFGRLIVVGPWLRVA
jgi:hypothetical protein